MPEFALDADREAIREMARGFADDTLAPHAVEWDQAKHFPVAEIRAAAALGMGAIYIREDVGGSALTRLDAAVIFEQLATGCPTVAAYISIHNMCAWMIDAYGNEAQRKQIFAAAGLHGKVGELLPYGTRRRLGRGRAAHPRGARRRDLRAQRPEAVHIRRRQSR